MELSPDRLYLTPEEFISVCLICFAKMVSTSPSIETDLEIGTVYEFFAI